MVGGEAPRPGSCCLLEQFPGTVSLLIHEVPFSVPVKKLSQRTQPTSPDPPSQASGRLVPGLVEGKGIRGWAPGAAGLHTGPACGAGTGTVLQSGSCLLCKQKHRVRMGQSTCPVPVAKHSLSSCWESPTLSSPYSHPLTVSLGPFPGQSHPRREVQGAMPHLDSVPYPPNF